MLDKHKSSDGLSAAVLLLCVMSSNSYGKARTSKYLGSLMTNQNSIQEEIKCRLKQKKIHFIIHSKHFCLQDFSSNSYGKAKTSKYLGSLMTNLQRKTNNWLPELIMVG